MCIIQLSTNDSPVKNFDHLYGPQYHESIRCLNNQKDSEVTSWLLYQGTCKSLVLYRGIPETLLRSQSWFTIKVTNSFLFDKGFSIMHYKYLLRYVKCTKLNKLEVFLRYPHLWWPYMLKYLIIVRIPVFPYSPFRT